MSDQKQPQATEPTTMKVGLVKLLPSPVLAWKTVYGRDFFQSSEYNLIEIGRIEDVESYVRQAYSKKVGLMFKSGYSLTGPNPKTINYITRRLAQLEQAQGKPFGILLREIGYDLVKYHNAYLVKVRRLQASGGQRRRDHRTGKMLDPVAAYFRMSPETVWIKRDIFGNVLQYRQQTSHGVKQIYFEPENVIHIYKDRKGGFAVGTPPLVPVLDDIRALRRLEENIELLVYQHLFPLLHYKVGTEDRPAGVLPTGESEIDVVRAQIESMPAEGCIVTPERHDISIIGAEGRALRADAYLNHFKQRVFAGLGMSAMDFGESGTANRSTAERLSRALIDNVKDYQEVLASFINHEIITELLLESTWGAEALEPENLVRFVFAEIDEDSKIKRNSNTINLYQSNLITESEARIDLGCQPLTEDQRHDMFFERVTKPRALIMATDEKYEEQSPSPSGSTATIQPTGEEVPDTPAGRRARNIVQPTNQYGKKPGPERRLSWADTEVSNNPGESRVLNLYTIFVNHTLNHIQNTRPVDTLWLQQLVYLHATQLQHLYSKLLRDEFFRNLQHDQQQPEVAVALQELLHTTSRFHLHFLQNILKTVLRRSAEINDGNSMTVIRALRDTIQQRALRNHQFLLQRTRLWAQAQSYRLQGRMFLEIINPEQEPGCPRCQQQQGRRVLISGMSLHDLPPFHSHCRCNIRPVQD